MKALPLGILTDKSIGNCSNGGISDRFREVLVIHEEGFIEVDEDNPPENLVKLVVRNLWGKEYKHLEPVAKIPNGSVGYMSGGTFAYSCDSRFRDLAEYPLPIHDRTETQKEYDRNFY